MVAGFKITTFKFKCHNVCRSTNASRPILMESVISIRADIFLVRYDKCGPTAPLKVVAFTLVWNVQNARRPHERVFNRCPKQNATFTRQNPKVGPEPVLQTSHFHSKHFITVYAVATRGVRITYWAGHFNKSLRRHDQRGWREGDKIILDLA